jgi:AbrB family looped-hinge helix DNA binding protein
MITDMSRLDSKWRFTLPREVRDGLGLRAGDLIAYRYTEAGVVIERVEPIETPFDSFTEWASPEDEEAFKDL